MEKSNEIKKKVDVITQRSAFALYKDKGIDEVRQQFPEHVHFVLDNKMKTLEQVTQELSGELSFL